MKSDQRSDFRIRPSIADDIGEGSFPWLMVVVTDQEALSMSYLKLVDVPYSLNDKIVTPEVVLSHSNGCGLSDLLILSTPPRVVRDSHMSDTTTVIAS